MDVSKRLQMGKKGRQCTIDNYSTEAVGKKLEAILDAMPDVDYNYDWEENKNTVVNLEDLLDDGQRIAVVMPESGGDVLWINSLMDNLKKLYPSHDIYVFTKPQFFDYIEDHPMVHKVLPYSSEIDNAHFLEGRLNHNGFFDIAFQPHYGTQRFVAYHHNGLDKTQLKLYEN
jgi:hypothetical protein